MVNFPPPSPENVWDSDEEEDGLADQDPLDVKWIPVHTFQVAVCSLPGDRSAGLRRSLVADLETLKLEGIKDVFVLCTDFELRRSKAHPLIEEYLQRGFIPHHYPYDDDKLPDMKQCLQLLEDLHTCLKNKKKVAIQYCTDGLGRSCLVLALLAMILDPDLPAILAIEQVRQTRGPRAIQTVKQYNFIMDFHKNMSEFRRQQQHDVPHAQQSIIPSPVAAVY